MSEPANESIRYHFERRHGDNGARHRRFVRALIRSVRINQDRLR